MPPTINTGLIVLSMNVFTISSCSSIQHRDLISLFLALVARHVFLDLHDGVVVVGNLDEIDLLGKAIVRGRQLREELRLRRGR